MRYVGLLCVALLFACETKEHADAELGALQKAKDAAARVAERSNTSPSQRIGIPECDSYIRSYESCLADRVPQERRGALRVTLNQQRTKWLGEVTSGDDRNAVAQQCKDAVAAATEATREFGCSF